MRNADAFDPPPVCLHKIAKTSSRSFVNQTEGREQRVDLKRKRGGERETESEISVSSRRNPFKSLTERVELELSRLLPSHFLVSPS